MAGKSGVGYSPGSGVEIASWIDNESDAHQLTVLEYLPSSTGTPDPVPVSPQNPLPVTVSSVTGNLAQETGGNLASIESSNAVIATDIASVETSASTIATAQGAGGTGITLPAGGTGILGWLSGIYSSLVGGVLGIYKSSAPTLTNNQTSPLLVDASGNLLVNVKTGGGTGGTSIADGSTFTSGSTLETLAAAAVLNSTPTLTAGKTTALATDINQNLLVNVNAGAAEAGTAGAPASDVLTVQGVASMTPVQTAPGGSNYSNTSYTSGTPAVTSAKLSGGVINSVVAVNLSSSVAFLKFWDATTSPTLGTTAASWQVPIPANTSGAGVVIPFPGGKKHANGIYYAVTGGFATNDNTAFTANSIVVDVTYN